MNGTKSTFSSAFAVLVASSSLARRGSDTQRSFSDHLPCRKGTACRPSSPARKQLPEPAPIERRDTETYHGKSQ